MTEKLKVSREVADAIEAARKSMSDEALLTYHAEGIVTSESFWAAKEIAALNQLSPYQLATALIVGYEVELTPHEVIASEYVTRQQDWINNMHLHSKGFVEGIEFTLNTLGITVEGVKQNGESFRI